MLDDGPDADAWLGLMKRRVIVEELVAFLYDSISSMTARAEEFLGHQQGVFDTCEVLIQFSWRRSDLVREWEGKVALLVSSGSSDGGRSFPALLHQPPPHARIVMLMEMLV